MPAEEDTERKSDVSAPHETTDVGDSPVMLLALHGPSDVDWDELQEKVSDCLRKGSLDRLKYIMTGRSA